jgi:N-acetyl-anhydromuramyl-L-alanine amidase AmpD
MVKPPDFEQTPLPSEAASQIATAFDQGTADSFTARALVRAGLVHYHPLHGGIFWRREAVKYIILHSTESGVPQSAPRVIESWGSMGIRHPGAQYVVDRDGSIYQAVDPDLATVHVNIFKTLPGINNDNSVGIEMCHSGRQDYPSAQRESVIRLITYLQERYKVADDNIVTHRYAQQGDHTDPVNFDFNAFLNEKNRFRNRAIAMRVHRINDEARQLPDYNDVSTASTLLQPHTQIKTPDGATTSTSADSTSTSATASINTSTSSVSGTRATSEGRTTATTTTVTNKEGSPSLGLDFSTPPVPKVQPGSSIMAPSIVPHTPSTGRSESTPAGLRGPMEEEPGMVKQLTSPPSSPSPGPPSSSGAK